MDVRNCKGCGRLFNYMGGAPLCQACQRALEDKFQEVKAYLDRKPNATIAEVSEEVDVSTKQIKHWIREERLSLVNAGADGITCETCGAPICTGRFCDKCKKSMMDTFSGTLGKPKVQEAPKKRDAKDRMRFL